MTYVAFLRGVNVGGKGMISMAVLKETFEGAGLSGVRTYINSGNVVFSTRASGTQALAGRIEKAIEARSRMSIKVLVLSHDALKEIVAAVPKTWVNDQAMRCDVWLLWKEVDRRKTLDQLPISPQIEDVKYTPGAVIWRIDRKNVTRSKMPRIIGTPLYQQLSIRNVNTIRKLDELMSAT